MNPDLTLRPNTPTIILVGGTFTADTGEHLDSRQPFADDPRSTTARQALAGSELWWLVTASLVLPLLDAEGDDSFAIAGGAKSVVTPRPDGTVRRRRLASVLQGGVRPSKSNGRWKVTYGAGLWREVDTHVLVDTTSMFWQYASALDDYGEFEQNWLRQKNLIIVGVHTHADTIYLNGYTEWVAAGRPQQAGGPQLPRRQSSADGLHAVLPVQAEFRVTGVVQNGTWIDPAPLEAARALLQARFDLRLGIWDLVTNDTLRATLLNETPIPAAPVTLAQKTVGAHERTAAWRAQRTEKQKSADAYRQAMSQRLSALDAYGWTTALPGVRGDVDPVHPYRRSLLVAVAPDCDDPEAHPRHPRLQPGTPILWIQLEIVPYAISTTRVELVAPPVPGTTCKTIVPAFYERQMPQLTKIATPYPSSGCTTFHSGGYTTYELMGFGGSVGVGKADWAQRIASVADRTSAWLELFAPLSKKCREAITAANPRPTGIGRGTQK
jgi:hypothetical protein